MGTAISARPAATAAANADLMVMVQGGTTKHITVQAFLESALRRVSSAGTAALPGTAVGAVTAGLFSGGSGATEYLGLAANGTEQARVHSGYFTIGTSTASSTYKTVIVGSSDRMLLLASNATLNTAKAFAIAVGRYDDTCSSSTQPTALYANAGTSTTVISVGGGFSNGRAATTVNLYAAANNTTVTGTELLRVTTAGVRIQSGVSASASDIFHVYSNTLSQNLILCGEATGSVGLCAAAVPAGTRAFAVGTSATAAGTDACAIGNGAAASSNYSYAIGLGTQANAAASMAFGNRASARSNSGKVAFAACFEPIAASAGIQQLGMICLGRQTTDATPTVLCSTSSAAGATNQAFIPNNSAYKFRGNCIATVTGAGDTASWTIEGCIKRGASAASTALVGTPTVTKDFNDAGAATWTLAVTADTTNGCIAVTATGEAGKTIRWNCYLQTTEVTY